MDLFSQPDKTTQPLAFRLRPTSLDHFVGQQHILGSGCLLRRLIQADQLSSLIFYGPPGTGKTTLAHIIAQTTCCVFKSVNAVFAGLKELRQEIEQAKENRQLYQKRTILFVDEVHRWNKAQQDALLPWVENGVVILIGATTENPFFEVNKALRSRSHIFQLKPLNNNDLRNILKWALTDKKHGYGALAIAIDPDAEEHLVRVADGDARCLLNALELAVETSRLPAKSGAGLPLSLEVIEQSIQQKAVLYDKDGDYHYDTISAFIKSMRGSDPDATLFWLARMVRAGENADFLFRRMLIFAAEDVGLADPQALVVVNAAAAAFDRVGLPEGRYHLTEAALYLANAAKSNSAKGFFKALKAVDEIEGVEVPGHLADSHRDGKQFDHGKGYLSPHDFAGHWVAQNYLPDVAAGRIFYQPSDQGDEAGMAAQITRRRQPQNPRNIGIGHLKKSARKASGPGLKSKNLWQILSEIVSIKTGQRLLIVGKEADRAAAYLAKTPRIQPDDVSDFAKNPKGSAAITSVPAKAVIDLPITPTFDTIICRNLFFDNQAKPVPLKSLADRLTSPGRLVLAETLPAASTRLTDLLQADSLKSEWLAGLKKAEKDFRRPPDSQTESETVGAIINRMQALGLTEWSGQTIKVNEKRLLSASTLAAWFSPTGIYGKRLLSLGLDPRELSRLQNQLTQQISHAETSWQRAYTLVIGKRAEQ